jgi:putative membrane protein
MHEPAQHPVDTSFQPYHISKPDPALIRYYIIVALLTGPAAPITFIPLVCKYLTLRYHFDDKGLAMSWGILWRREVLLTYRRIQDIHLTRNIIQRWLGLATVSVQTAAGSATPEMSIEGILEAEQLRDFLYSKMRGAKGLTAETAEPAAAPQPAPPDEALTLLREIRDCLQRLTQLVQTAPRPASQDPGSSAGGA